MATALQHHEDVEDVQDESPAQLALEIPEGAYRLQITYVPHAHVHPDPEQPRVDADADLRASIAAEGIRQAITVRPHPEILGEYMIVDGERRWRGAAGVQDEIPVVIREDQDDRLQRLIGQLVSNTGRPLTPIEEARAYAQLLEANMTHTEAAERLGIPRTTFGDRVRLLELGPWIPLIESGAISTSLAVEHLVPIRGVPDKYHEQIIAKLDQDYRWKRNGEGAGISTHDFDRLLSELARPLFYPLTKTKTSYAKQPEFDTRHHDAECSCGGVQFDIGHGVRRRCCGNPDWWRPRHRKALAEKKKTEAAASTKKTARVPAWAKLPAEASTRKEKYHYNERQGETSLVRGGRWDMDRPEEGFDPDVLLAQLRPEKLILVESGYEQGSDKYTIATTDQAAVKAARTSYEARWAERRGALAAARRAKLQAVLDEPRFEVGGGGTRTLLAAAAQGSAVATLLYELADDVLVLEGVPTLKRDQGGHADGRPFLRWLDALEPNVAAQLATAFVAARGTWKKTIGEELREKQISELDTLRKTPITWPGAKAKKAKGKKSTAGSGKGAKRKDPRELLSKFVPSDALAAIVGAEAKPRHEVTKKLWDYIRKHDLQDKAERRMINADDTLRPVFGGKDRVSMFDLTKCINAHLEDASAITDEEMDELEDHVVNDGGDVVTDPDADYEIVEDEEEELDFDHEEDEGDGLWDEEDED